jgi:hypothetical protein
MRNTQTDFVESLKAAARENPLAAGLIAGGALWLLIGNDRLKGAVSSAAAAASSTVDLGSRNLRAAGSKFETTSAPPTVPEMEVDHDGQSRVQDTFRQARSTASDAMSGAVDQISGVADSMRDRLDEGVAYARENFSKMSSPLPDRDTLEWARSSLSDVFERQPLVLGAIGLAIGAAVAGAFQTSEIENELVGELSDTVKEDLSTRSEAVAKHVREGVNTLSSEISNAGAESIDRLKQAGRDALDVARETTKGEPKTPGKGASLANQTGPG